MSELSPSWWEYKLTNRYKKSSTSRITTSQWVVDDTEIKANKVLQKKFDDTNNATNFLELD